MAKHLQSYLEWRIAESRVDDAAKNFKAAIGQGRHPTEAEMGELSRLRTAACAALHIMIMRSKQLAKLAA